MYIYRLLINDFNGTISRTRLYDLPLSVLDSTILH